MSIEVHLLGEISYFTNGRTQFEVSHSDIVTIDDVLRKLKIPNNEVVSIIINQKLVTNREIALKDGDKIVFLPVVSGG